MACEYKWIPTTLEVYLAIYNQHKDSFSVFETLTDMEGRFGVPRIVTAWGFKTADAPLIRSEATKERGAVEWQKWKYHIALVTHGED